MVRLAGRLPLGALAAGLVVGLIHVLAGLAYPEPIARDSLRDKVLTLTAGGRPSLLVAGDSRAASQVIPEVLAGVLGVAGSEVVNIGTPAGEPAVALAAYREFAPRFSHRPIMLLSVGIWSVNDCLHEGVFLGNETLWSLGFIDRWRLTSGAHAIRAVFLPERACAAGLIRRCWPDEPPDPVTRLILSGVMPGGMVFGRAPASMCDRGYVRVTEDVTADPEGFARTTRGVANLWYIGARLDGIRWRLFEANLDRLLADGVQVVLLDTPQHPAVLAALEGTSGAEAADRFHRQLVEVGERKGVPLLSYDGQVFEGRCQDRLFGDASHVNAAGATILSERIGRDLRALIDAGRLRLRP